MTGQEATQKILIRNYDKLLQHEGGQTWAQRPREAVEFPT